METLPVAGMEGLLVLHVRMDLGCALDPYFITMPREKRNANEAAA
ncbi:MAG TPA: hypothetical protein VHL54_10100 [Actinomycetota bacterium]|nr:hypothetical protein [Actinomycetota bacterium]